MNILSPEKGGKRRILEKTRVWGLQTAGGISIMLGETGTDVPKIKNESSRRGKWKEN